MHERIIAVRQTDEPIPFSLREPHYTDHRFSHPQTIFLGGNYETHKRYSLDVVDGAIYDYSDRFVQWYGYDKCKEAKEEANNLVGNNDSAKFFEQYLRILTGDADLKLVHILSGVNLTNGYPYLIFGYLKEN